MKYVVPHTFDVRAIDIVVDETDVILCKQVFRFGEVCGSRKCLGKQPKPVEGVHPNGFPLEYVTEEGSTDEAVEVR